MDHKKKQMKETEQLLTDMMVDEELGLQGFI
jgi:hypothetical protein